ncbi:ABC transporter G family member 43 [Capsicum chinense]|nr:ABC transporter G family member 43 [Capsicum chinense]
MLNGTKIVVKGLKKNYVVLYTYCQSKYFDYGLPEDKFLFACFDQLAKMDPEIFMTWCNILKRVPNSALWLLRFLVAAEMRLHICLQPDRIIFTDVAMKQEHISFVDLFLDIMTLLLGPLGYGKTTLLKALSGSLEKSLKVSREISYNVYKLPEFVPQKTSVYISQNNLYFPEMTVRETLDYSSCFQESKVEQAIFVEGQKTNIQTDYILKILGLDICADTLVGDAMRRGISGGQKKRLTTTSMPIWLKWGFWISPLTYGEIGLAVNEFLAPRWQKSSDAASGSISPMDARRSRDDNDPNDIL